MHVLITGKGTSGSWRIRGLQLGAAIGADAIPNAVDIAKYDLAVIVKRTPEELVRRIKRAGVPMLWDVVDAWPQPPGNEWCEPEAKAWLAAAVKEVKPRAIVAATRAMAIDCAQFGVPAFALPHHARPNMRRNPIREAVTVVGYEGGPQYLGRWQKKIEDSCNRRGWIFVVNPDELASVDIVVAVRDQTGYAPKHWKSNVKLANAQGSGTPCIVNTESGYVETASGAEFWADDMKEMEAAFDALESQEARRAVGDRLYAAAPKLDKIAEDYKAWLTTIR
jgi:hypothetical protein